MRCSERALGIRPRKDHRGVDLISDALPFGRRWYRARIVFDCQTVNESAMMVVRESVFELVGGSQ